MDEAERWIAMLEAIGRHALDCAAEIRALRTRSGDNAATRSDDSTQDGDLDDGDS